MARNYIQGRFTPQNPEKYVGDVNNICFRSSWELKLFRWCDTQKNVIKWNSEELVIPYFSRADNKMRRYFTDLVIQVKTTEGKLETIIVEVKPEAQTKPPERKRGKRKSTLLEETYTYMVNQDKWAAADEYARKRGMRFMVLTEKELGVK